MGLEIHRAVAIRVEPEAIDDAVRVQVDLVTIRPSIPVQIVGPLGAAGDDRAQGIQAGSSKLGGAAPDRQERQRKERRLA